jgi:hypothetical protein
MQRHIPQGNTNLCKHTPPRRYRLLKHITLIVSTNEIARRVLATEPNVPLLVVEYTAGFPCKQFILTLQKINHSLSPAPPFLYTSHVRTTRVRTHDVTGYNLTLTSGTRRVRTQKLLTSFWRENLRYMGRGVILLSSRIKLIHSFFNFSNFASV